MKFVVWLCLMGCTLSGALVAAPLVFIAPEQIEEGEYTVSKPGLYVLTDDARYPKSCGAAITILSDNVTLDLNGKTVSASSAGDHEMVRIGLEAPCAHVTVKNGKSLGFSSGIVVHGGASHINLYDLMLSGRDLTGLGIHFMASSEATQQCMLDKCHITHFKHGLSAYNVDSLQLHRSTASNNGSRGLNLFVCTGWELADCYISSNGHKSDGTADVAGMCIDGCTGFRIKQSDFSSNINRGISGNGRGYGLVQYGEQVSGCFEITGCSFSNNGGVNAGRGLSLDGTEACIVKQCVCNRNFSKDGAARGLSLSGTGHYIESCIANENVSSALEPFAATGIVVTGSAHTIAACHTAGNTSVGGSGIGLLIYGAAECCFVKNCTSIANSRVGFQDDARAKTNLWIGNLSWGHNEYNYVGDGLSAISFAAGTQPTTGTFDERGMNNISVVQ